MPAGWRGGNGWRERLDRRAGRGDRGARRARARGARGGVLAVGRRARRRGVHLRREALAPGRGAPASGCPARARATRDDLPRRLPGQRRAPDPAARPPRHGRRPRGTTGRSLRDGGPARRLRRRRHEGRRRRRARRAAGARAARRRTSPRWRCCSSATRSGAPRRSPTSSASRAGMRACASRPAQRTPDGGEAVVVRRKAAGTLHVPARAAPPRTPVRRPTSGRNALLALAAAAQAVADAHDPSGPRPPHRGPDCPALRRRVQRRAVGRRAVLRPSLGPHCRLPRGARPGAARGRRRGAARRVRPHLAGDGRSRRDRAACWPRRPGASAGRSSARARGGASDASHFAPSIPLTVDGLGPRGGGAHAPRRVRAARVAALPRRGRARGPSTRCWGSGVRPRWPVITA